MQQSLTNQYHQRRDAARATEMQVRRETPLFSYEVKAFEGRVLVLTPDFGGWIIETLGA